MRKQSQSSMTKKVKPSTKATLTFNLTEYEGRYDYKIMNDAHNFYRALTDLSEEFRRIEKYESSQFEDINKKLKRTEDSILIDISDLRELFSKVLEENKVDFSRYE